MSDPHELRCYDYVNRPYAVVREALRSDAQAIFHRATTGAARRADDVGATLRVALGALEVGAEVELRVLGLEEQAAAQGRPAETRVLLAWRATRAAALFPEMSAELAVYALSATETQLDLRGQYRPPFGLLGNAIDSVALHRVAEASVHRFVEDVAEHLRTTLPQA